MKYWILFFLLTWVSGTHGQSIVQLLPESSLDNSRWNKIEQTVGELRQKIQEQEKSAVGVRQSTLKSIQEDLDYAKETLKQAKKDSKKKGKYEPSVIEDLEKRLLEALEELDNTTVTAESGRAYQRTLNYIEKEVTVAIEARRNPNMLKVSMGLPLDEARNGVLFIPYIVGQHTKNWNLFHVRAHVGAQPPSPRLTVERTASRVLAKGGVGYIGLGSAFKWETKQKYLGVNIGGHYSGAWQSEMDINDSVRVPFFFFHNISAYSVVWFGPLLLSYENKSAIVLGKPGDPVSDLIEGSRSHVFALSVRIETAKMDNPFFLSIRMTEPDFVTKVTEDNFEFRIFASRDIGL